MLRFDTVVIGSMNHQMLQSRESALLDTGRGNHSRELFRTARFDQHLWPNGSA